MSLDFFKSTGFRIKDLKISSKNGVDIDISGLYLELNIFDSILQPCLTGNILIEDAVGLTNTLLFDGNEFLKINIGKTDDDDLDIKRIFRIYKQTNRKLSNQNTQTYILHFVSEEYVVSKLTKVGQAFESTYTGAALIILKDYMKAPNNKITGGVFDASMGVKSIVIPAIFNPIDAMLWMSKLAIDQENRPGFLFYENIFGYNFASLSTLLKNNSIVNINFDPKNLSTSTEVNDFLGARYFEVIQQYDILKNIENGVYGGKFLGYDPETHSYIERVFTYNDVNHPKSDENSAPSVGDLKTHEGSTLTNHSDASLSLGTTNLPASYSDDVNENYSESMQKRYDYENSTFQRKSMFANLFSQRVKLVVPGNFLMTSGYNVFLNVPNFSQKIPGEDNLDKTLYGSYLIIASRHKLTPDNKHETIFEACTNSSNRTEKYAMYSRSDYVSGEYNA